MEPARRRLPQPFPGGVCVRPEARHVIIATAARANQRPAVLSDSHQVDQLLALELRLRRVGLDGRQRDRPTLRQPVWPHARENPGEEDLARDSRTDVQCPQRRTDRVPIAAVLVQQLRQRHPSQSLVGCPGTARARAARHEWMAGPQVGQGDRTGGLETALAHQPLGVAQPLTLGLPSLDPREKVPRLRALEAQEPSSRCVHIRVAPQPRRGANLRVPHAPPGPRRA